MNISFFILHLHELTDMEQYLINQGILSRRDSTAITTAENMFGWMVLLGICAFILWLIFSWIDGVNNTCLDSQGRVRPCSEPYH
jgi:hypothetical protein